jgi:hypothetical protein
MCGSRRQGESRLGSRFLRGLSLRPSSRVHRLAVEEGTLLARGQQVNLARLRLLLTDRDFNGNGESGNPDSRVASCKLIKAGWSCSDYEMLRALDDDNVASSSHGLTPSELSRLPIHIVR